MQKKVEYQCPDGSMTSNVDLAMQALKTSVLDRLHEVLDASLGGETVARLYKVLQHDGPSRVACLEALAPLIGSKVLAPEEHVYFVLSNGESFATKEEARDELKKRVELQLLEAMAGALRAIDHEDSAPVPSLDDSTMQRIVRQMVFGYELKLRNVGWLLDQTDLDEPAACERTNDP